MLKIAVAFPFADSCNTNKMQLYNLTTFNKLFLNSLMTNFYVTDAVTKASKTLVLCSKYLGKKHISTF